MKEKTLLKIALTCSIIGVFLIFIFSNIYKINEKNISEIKIEDDKYAKITGTITKIIETNKTKIITISKNEEITLVMFSDYPLNLEKGDSIEAKGKIEKYKGEKEIITDEIRLLKK